MSSVQVELWTANVSLNFLVQRSMNSFSKTFGLQFGHEVNRIKNHRKAWVVRNHLSNLLLWAGMPPTSSGCPGGPTWPECLQGWATTAFLGSCASTSLSSEETMPS